MTPADLHTLATGSALRALGRKSHVVEMLAARGDNSRVLSARLVEGQFDCAEQLRTVSIFALRCVMPVIGQDWTLATWDNDIAGLRAQLKGAARDISAVSVDAFTEADGQKVRHKAGDALLTQDATDYLIQFAIPNLWFHLSMAYAILRREGVEIGKADFDGLHAYPQGFSFV